MQNSGYVATLSGQYDDTPVPDHHAPQGMIAQAIIPQAIIKSTVPNRTDRFVSLDGRTMRRNRLTISRRQDFWAHSFATCTRDRIQLRLLHQVRPREQATIASRDTIIPTGHLSKVPTAWQRIVAKFHIHSNFDEETLGLCLQ